MILRVQIRRQKFIIEEISRAIMWVNEREEEELMFDWGDKNIDQYIPKKQESYSVRISTYTPGWVFLSQFMGLIIWHVYPSNQNLRVHIVAVWDPYFLFLFFLTEADEGPGGEGEGAKQAEGESRWTPEQQPSCLG